MAPQSSLTVSLAIGKTIARIAAEFSLVPGLPQAVGLLCEIVQLCENVSSNKLGARQLCDRCYNLLLAVRDSGEDITSGKMKVALDATEECFRDIIARMNEWTSLNRFQSLIRQKEVAEEISRCDSAVSDCLSGFQLTSHMNLHGWNQEFSITANQQHIEMMESLSKVQNSQDIANVVNSESAEHICDIMGMLQLSLRGNVEADSGKFSDIPRRLYEYQVQSGQLLPNFYLKSGEVVRIGEDPVSRTSTADIYEGRYLQSKKVTMKAIYVGSGEIKEKTLRRFMREVKIWEEVWRIDHGEHVLPFYGFCHIKNTYIAMISPWQNNGNAINYVKSNDNEVDYKGLMRGIALGIEVLHNLTPPVVHGDLRGDNIVINNRGNPLIANFGFSQILADVTSVPFTQSCSTSGSYRWSAPELCIGSGILSTASDIYAYAMTILELLTHEKPYSRIERTACLILEFEMGQRPPRPTGPQVTERGLDDDLWCLMNDCWKSDPLSRPSIKEVLARLPSWDT